MIEVSGTAVTALTGLLGVLLGGAIQVAIAHFNRRHTRSLAFETKRAEVRLEVYVELVKHILLKENEEKRTIRWVKANGAGGAGSTGSKLEPDLAARLATVGSLLLQVMVDHWLTLWHEAALVYTFRELLLSASELKSRGIIEVSVADDLDDIARLMSVTDRRAKKAAERVISQVQAEIRGDDSWYRPTRRIKVYIERRREERVLRREEEFVDTEIERFRSKSDLIASLLPQVKGDADQEKLDID